MHSKKLRFRPELTVLSNDVPDGGSWSNRPRPSHSHTHTPSHTKNAHSHPLPLSQTHSYTLTITHVHIHSHKHDVNEKVCLVSQAMGDWRPVAFCLSWNWLELANSPSLSSPGIPSPRAGKEEVRITFLSCNRVEGREAGGQVGTVRECASMCAPC